MYSMEYLKSNITITECDLCHKERSNCIIINTLQLKRSICMDCSMAVLFKIMALLGSEEITLDDVHNPRKRAEPEPALKHETDENKIELNDKTQCLEFDLDEYTYLFASQAGIKDEEYSKIKKIGIEEVSKIKSSVKLKLKRRIKIEPDPLGLIEMKSDPNYKQRKQYMYYKFKGIKNLDIARIIRIPESTFYKLADEWDDEDRIRRNKEVGFDYYYNLKAQE